MRGCWLLHLVWFVAHFYNIVAQYDEDDPKRWDKFLKVCAVPTSGRALGLPPGQKRANRLSKFTLMESGSSSEADQFIVGGRTPTRGRYPYSISLQAYYEDEGVWKHECGGALVTRRRVVTAAHCTDLYRFGHPLRICANCYDLNVGKDPNAQYINVTKVQTHPLYNEQDPGGTNQPSDIAVLYLQAKVKTGSKVKTIGLSRRSRLTYRTCDITGWGHPSVQSTENSARFQHARVSVMKDSDCRRNLKITSDGVVHKTNLCTLTYPALISGCSGDAGAPLACLGQLAGVLSWGLKSCNGCVPDVYTRVSNHYTWIKKYL